MSKNVIFCFSGTGNCLDIAKNIARSLGDTDIVMMRRAPAVRDVHEAERVGFVFPCYAGGLPGDVEKYVRSLFVSAKAYTFGVVSYAGYPGVGLAKINEIVPLSYHAGISHQSACIWLMPHTLMVPPLTPEKAQARSEEHAAKIAEDIKNGVRSEKAPSAPLFNKLESSVWPKSPRISGTACGRRKRPPRRSSTSSSLPSGPKWRRKRRRASPSRASASAAASAPRCARRATSKWSAAGPTSAPTASSA